MQYPFYDSAVSYASMCLHEHEHLGIDRGYIDNRYDAVSVISQISDQVEWLERDHVKMLLFFHNFIHSVYKHFCIQPAVYSLYTV